MADRADAPLTRLERYLEANPQAPRTAIVGTRLLFRIAHLFEQRVEAALAPHALSMRDYLALAFISADQGRAIRPSELGVSLDATRTQVTRLLDGLEARALVRRLASDEDRRSLELELTAAGRKLLERATPAVHACYAQVWGALSEQRLRATLGSLRSVHDALAGARS